MEYHREKQFDRIDYPEGAVVPRYRMRGRGIREQECLGVVEPDQNIKIDSALVNCTEVGRTEPVFGAVDSSGDNKMLYIPPGTILRVVTGSQIAYPSPEKTLHQPVLVNVGNVLTAGENVQPSNYIGLPGCLMFNRVTSSKSESDPVYPCDIIGFNLKVVEVGRCGDDAENAISQTFFQQIVPSLDNPDGCQKILAEFSGQFPDQPQALAILTSRTNWELARKYYRGLPDVDCHNLDERAETTLYLKSAGQDYLRQRAEEFFGDDVIKEGFEWAIFPLCQVEIEKARLQTYLQDISESGHIRSRPGLRYAEKWVQSVQSILGQTEKRKQERVGFLRREAWAGKVAELAQLGKMYCGLEESLYYPTAFLRLWRKAKLSNFTNAPMVCELEQDFIEEIAKSRDARTVLSVAESVLRKQKDLFLKYITTTFPAAVPPYEWHEGLKTRLDLVMFEYMRRDVAMSFLRTQTAIMGLRRDFSYWDGYGRVQTLNGDSNQYRVVIEKMGGDLFSLDEATRPVELTSGEIHYFRSLLPN